MPVFRPGALDQRLELRAQAQRDAVEIHVINGQKGRYGLAVLGQDQWLFLKLAGRDVLVVGAGPIGTSKARSLVEAGARVTVVAPDAEPELHDLAAAGALVLHARPFVDVDVDGAWLVVAAAIDLDRMRGVAPATAK